MLSTRFFEPNSNFMYDKGVVFKKLTGSRTAVSVARRA